MRKNILHAAAALTAAALSALLCCTLAPSCTRQDLPENVLTACPGELGGAADPAAGAALAYIGGDGRYTVSLCDCGEYASSTPNPLFEPDCGDPALSAHYRFFFPDGPGEDAVLWFFTPPRP